MSNNINSVGFFTPIRWGAQKNINEKSHWLGKIVEPYFDLGGNGKLVSRQISHNRIMVTDDIYTPSPKQTAAKVFRVIFTVLSFFTIIIPLVMLIGKGVYRSKNHFVDRFKSDDLKRCCENLIQRYQDTGKISEKIDKFVDRNFTEKACLDSIVSLSQEINAAIEEVTELKNIRKSLIKNEFKNLDNTLEKLETEKEKLVAYLAAENIQNEIKNTLAELHHKTKDELQSFRDDNDQWNDKFNQLLNTAEEQTDEVKHQLLLDHSRDTKLHHYTTMDKFSLILQEMGQYVVDKEFLNELTDLSNEIIEELKPSGLPNLGNTCYLNSLLQVFANTPQYYTVLNNEVESHKDNKLLQSVKVFIHAHRLKDPTAIKFALNQIRSVLYQQGKLEGLKKQHDASEVLGEILSSGEFPIVNVATVQKYEVNGEKGETKSSDEVRFLHIPVTNEGYVISRSLQGVIDSYYSTKVVKDQCIKDDSMGVADGWTQSNTLEKAPELMTIALNRYEWENGTAKKISCPTAFSHQGILDFSSAFENGGAPDGGSTKYKVVSVIEHSGGYGSGHYTAAVNKGNQWFNCNDRKISRKLNDVTEQGYMFTLQRLPG